MTHDENLNESAGRWGGWIARGFFSLVFFAVGIIVVFSNVPGWDMDGKATTRDFLFAIPFFGAGFLVLIYGAAATVSAFLFYFYGVYLILMETKLWWDTGYQVWLFELTVVLVTLLAGIFRVQLLKFPLIFWGGVTLCSLVCLLLINVDLKGAVGESGLGLQAFMFLSLMMSLSARSESMMKWVKQLNDVDADVRADSARRLKKIGSPAVPILIKTLNEQGSESQCSVITILADIDLGPKRLEVISALVEKQNDENEEVREAAEAALREIRPLESDPDGSRATP